MLAEELDMGATMKRAADLIRLTTKMVVILVGAILILILTTIVLPYPAFLVLKELLLGWWSFVDRIVPLITLNWDLLGMAAVCVGGVLGLSHWLLSRFARWRFRSSMALNGLVWLSFFTATAVAGVVEQTRWLCAAEHEPGLVVTKRGTRVNQLVRSLSWEVERRLWEGLTVEAAMAGFQADHAGQFAPPNGRYRDLRVFCLVNATNGYAGLIVFRRPEIVHPDHQVALHSPESPTMEYPPEELPRLLSQPGLTAVPLF
jgi:hypothetical protein